MESKRLTKEFHLSDLSFTNSYLSMSAVSSGTELVLFTFPFKISVNPMEFHNIDKALYIRAGMYCSKRKIHYSNLISRSAGGRTWTSRTSHTCVQFMDFCYTPPKVRYTGNDIPAMLGFTSICTSSILKIMETT